MHATRIAAASPHVIGTRVTNRNAMKFPGSKLLHHWDLATHKVPLDDVLRSCQQVGLTGLAEVKFPQAVAMIFYLSLIHI